MITRYNNIKLIASLKKPYLGQITRRGDMRELFVKDCYLVNTIDMIYGQKEYDVFIRPHKAVRL